MTQQSPSFAGTTKIITLKTQNIDNQSYTTKRARLISKPRQAYENLQINHRPENYQRRGRKLFCRKNNKRQHFQKSQLIIN